MWGSAVIGLHHANIDSLDKAFKLLAGLTPVVRAHTVEQFAFSEILREKAAQIHPAKKWTIDWSSTGKKNYVSPLLANYFSEYSENDFETHLRTHQTLKLRRPILTWLKQKIKKC